VAVAEVVPGESGAVVLNFEVESGGKAMDADRDGAAGEAGAMAYFIEFSTRVWMA
jgi:hypothetical protein